jgi:hypothetical protein
MHRERTSRQEVLGPCKPNAFGHKLSQSTLAVSGVHVDSPHRVLKHNDVKAPRAGIQRGLPYAIIRGDSPEKQPAATQACELLREIRALKA